MPAWLNDIKIGEIYLCRILGSIVPTSKRIVLPLAFKGAQGIIIRNNQESFAVQTHRLTAKRALLK